MGGLPPEWISLKPHLPGVLAVAIAANLSLFTIAALVSFICLLLWRFYSTGNENERRERKMNNKAIRFLASTHGLLFLDLLLGVNPQLFLLSLPRWSGMLTILCQTVGSASSDWFRNKLQRELTDKNSRKPFAKRERKNADFTQITLSVVSPSRFTAYREPYKSMHNSSRPHSSRRHS